MDLLVEKGNNKTYLSQLGFLVTSFEEGAPTIARNSTNIQGRSGSVDFGGWHESKKVKLEGFYRAEDQYEEETLKERLFALLSDPEGIYITEMRGEIGQGFERPGETEGEVYEHMMTRPSHKRFYVYASSIENEFQGNVGGTVLYKMSVEFTTLKLPYGESVPRDLDVKPSVPYYSENLALGTSTPVVTVGNGGTNQAFISYSMSGVIPEGTILVVNCNVESTDGTGTFIFQPYGSDSGSTWQQWTHGSLKKGSQKVTATFVSQGNIARFYPRFDNATGTITISDFIISAAPSPWSPAPADPGYNKWYIKTYYNTKNIVIPYAGTVPCSQLEQGFTVEFTAKEGGSGLSVYLDWTKLTYNGKINSGDVFKFSGYEYTKNGVSIVKDTNKAYFKLFPGIANKISSSLAGTIRILGFQELYA